MKKRAQTAFAHAAVRACILALAVVGTRANAESGAGGTAGDDSGSGLKLGGYVRAYASWMLSDTPETTQDDKGKLSILRGQALLDASGKAGPVSFKAIARFDRESKTAYLRRLETLTQGAGSSNRLMDIYNEGELREAYVEFDATDRLHFKIGKQQVVWGESDFFHAMDLVHGFNSVWAPPAEDSDETRKPLVMVNAKLAVPEANGALQLIVRPGWDRDKDIGNTPDIFGGRNAGLFYRGFDARTIVNFDYRHPDANVSKATWGTRWTGMAGPLNYSLAYLKTFSPNFVINSRLNPYQKTPTGPVGDLIYPEMEVFGATVNGYSSGVDAVLSAEVAYQKDVAYNAGTGPLIGLNGIKKKNQVRSMLRMDKNIDLTAIGAIKPSLWSMQIFDTWIQDFKESDDLVLIPTYGRPAKKHETVITSIFALSYANSNINPTLVLAYDLTNGGGFIVPYVDFTMGNDWRLRAEVDYFFHSHQTNPPDREVSPTNFGLAGHNNQFVLRLTRQF